jgi:hypothetical protein
MTPRSGLLFPAWAPQAAAAAAGAAGRYHRALAAAWSDSSSLITHRVTGHLPCGRRSFRTAQSAYVDGDGCSGAVQPGWITASWSLSENTSSLRALVLRRRPSPNQFRAAPRYKSADCATPRPPRPPRPPHHQRHARRRARAMSATRVACSVVDDAYSTASCPCESQSRCGGHDVRASELFLSPIPRPTVCPGKRPAVAALLSTRTMLPIFPFKTHASHAAQAIKS